MENGSNSSSAFVDFSIREPLILVIKFEWACGNYGSAAEARFIGSEFKTRIPDILDGTNRLVVRRDKFWEVG